VKKGQVKSESTEVDGLTGATLTTKGAAAMVTDGLQQYINFFNANAK
jgi:Na+-transporting NADH:ubiquinone oxidoreductase subunit NqrC